MEATPPGRGASHTSQWRALATLLYVHFEQAHGMCWLCIFVASCALNVIGIVVPSRFRARLRELGLEYLRARNFPSDNFCERFEQSRFDCERAARDSVAMPLFCVNVPDLT